MKAKKAIIGIAASVCAALMLTSCGTNGTSSDPSASPASGSDFDTSKAITVVSREDGSGTRGAFVELLGIEQEDESGNTKDMTTKEAIIASKTDVMLTNIANDPYAIGYVSLGSLNNTVCLLYTSWPYIFNSKMIYILLYLAGYYKVLAFFIKIQYTVNPTL